MKEYVAVKPHASLDEELNCIWTPAPHGASHMQENQLE